jgi:hypothetical protein
MRSLRLFGEEVMPRLQERGVDTREKETADVIG